MGAPWTRGIAEAEARIAEVSLFLRDLPATSDPVLAGRCRRALARAKISRDAPFAKLEILQGVRADLEALGYKSWGVKA
jgi:hypothetical protein